MEPNLPPRLLPNLSASRPGASLPWEGGGGFAPFVPTSLGADLVVFLRDSASAMTLSTVGEWKDQSPTGLLYAQATQASRPSASTGAALFPGGAGANTLEAGTTALGSDSITALLRFTLTAAAGTTYPTLFNIRTSATKALTAFLDPAAGFNWLFRHGTTASAAAVGNDIALDTSPHTFTITSDGAGAYVGRVDGVNKTLTGTISVSTSLTHSIGGVTGVGATSNGTHHSFVVYSSILTGATLAAAEALMASSTSTYNDFAALGTVVCCLLPGVGQSGDISAQADLGPAGNNFAHATLANQPYFDRDDSAGDGLPSVIYDGTADNLTHADIAALAGIPDMTVSFSFRPGALATATIVGQKDGADNSWWVEQRVDGKLRFYTASAGADATNFVETDAACLTANTWGTYAIVKQGATAAVYSAGALVASTVTGAIEAVIRNSALAVKLMTDGTTFSGTRIDNLVIGKRAITAGQAASLARYNPRSG